MKYFIYFLFIFLIACNGLNKPEKHANKHTANEHMNSNSFSDLVKRFESAERANWQLPDTVLSILGTVDSLTIMDLGAGTGYFSFPLVKQGAKVIAADVDERFIEYMTNKRDSLGIADSLMEIRQVPYDGPALDEHEIDIFFTVNTYHHIENRVEYLKKVKAGLKPNGKVIIIDFKKKETPHGPPKEMRIGSKFIHDEVKAAGFENILIDMINLPEQNIIIGYLPNEI